MGLGQAKGLSQAKASRGWAIVTGLQFINSSADWPRNEEMLISHGALMRDGIDVFDVRQNMPETVNLQRVGLVVVGGFYPHWRASAVVQALAHQMPSASLMILYASRDKVPRYQDLDKVHIEAWTADASKGYVVKAGGGCGHSRCYSEESVKDGVWSDPSLVKVSIFTSAHSQAQRAGERSILQQRKEEAHIHYHLAGRKARLRLRCDGMRNAIKPASPRSHLQHTLCSN